jgi:hemerythrin
MPLFEWTDALAVGNETIDDDHRHLVDLINQLFLAISSGQANAVLGEILDELVSYTQTHFQREEALMQQHDYPDYALHKAAHDKLIEEVRVFQEQFAAGLVVSPMTVFNFLGGWLFRHIQACDVCLGKTLKGEK